MTKEDFRRKLRGNTMTTSVQEGIVLDRENDVVRVGYRSAQDQIRELTRAGINLQINRQEAYSKPTGINARMYGEIDRTVAHEKIGALKATFDQELERRETVKREKAERAAEEAKKAMQTTPKEGGVT